MARQYAPYDYLAGIKQSSGSGYVSPNERNTLTRLVEQGQLPGEVVNILIYHIIVQKENTTLKASLADGIANAWIKAGVKTAADAIREIKNHKKDNDRQVSSKPKRRYYSTGRSNINEELPEWAKHPEKVVDKKPTDEQKAEFRKMLAEFNKRNTDSDSKV